MEEWREIDDRYSVSNLGRVKSNYANKERILKPYFNKCGYLMVDLRHPSTRKSVSVHRLVAFAFIPNPDNLKEVNHKDEDKTNNRVDNLEWCDTKYNCNYGTRNIRKGLNCRKRICSVDSDGEVIHYGSRLEASESTGIDATSISKALKSIAQHTAGGLLWFYDDGTVDELINSTGMRPVTWTKAVFSIDNNNIAERYVSIAEAKRLTGINNISRAIKNRTTAGGKRWFYAT